MARASLVQFLFAGVRDLNNEPLTSGKVYHYDAGTTTLRNLYTGPDKSSPVAQPIILDAQGMAEVYGDGNYRFAIFTAADVPLYDVDNVYVGLGPNAIVGGAATGPANAQVINPSPPIADYQAGQLLGFTPVGTNTASTTVTVSGLPAKSIKKFGASNDVEAGDLVLNGFAFLYYDGAQYQLVGANPPLVTWVPVVTGNGTITVSGLSTSYAYYRRFGRHVHLHALMTFTTGGVDSSKIVVTLPIASSNIGGQGMTMLIGTTGLVAGMGYVNTASTNLDVYLIGGGNWGLGAGRQIFLNCAYLVG